MSLLTLCRIISPLTIANVAYKKVTGYWMDDDIPEPPLFQEHMEECKHCQKWYSNAVKIYTEMKEKGEL